MSRPTIIGDGPERQATDAEIAAVLTGHTLDGTSYAQLWADSQDEDEQ